MVDVGPLLPWYPSTNGSWRWQHTELRDEDIVWLEEMMALAHEGHPKPDTCWITFERVWW